MTLDAMLVAARMSEIEFGIKIEQYPIFMDLRHIYTFHLRTEKFSICSAGPHQHPGIKQVKDGCIQFTLLTESGAECPL